jgi:hypothetical protein
MRKRLATFTRLVNEQKILLSPQAQIVFLAGDRDLFEDEKKKWTHK